jgi:hypothetical protein
MHVISPACPEPLTLSHDHREAFPENMEVDLMRRPVTIAIVLAMISLAVLIFWQVAAASVRPKPEFTVTSGHYLPIKRLDPVY